MSLLDTIRNVIVASPQSSQWPSRVVGPGAVESDLQRVANYRRYQDIYFGRFASAFPYETTFVERRQYGTHANLAARSVDALHSAIWSKPPVPKSDDEALTLFSQEVMENAKIQESISDSVRDTILYGDGVLKISVENGKVKIRNIHPGLYFPELKQPLPQEPTAHNIVYAEGDPTGWYVRERYWLNPDTGTYWLTVSRFYSATGEEDSPLSEIDLRCTSSPIIHTYGTRLSGIFYGKAPMVDAQQSIAEYAATVIKIARITEMASTKALLAAPYNAFDENQRLAWDTNRPYMVDDSEMATFDKNKFGWLSPPATELIAPNIEVLDKIEAAVYNTFGLTKLVYGDTGTIRDVGKPGLQRANLMMEFTVNRYQVNYNIFLSDALNVAAQFAKEWLGISDLPSTYVPVAFTWPDFAPKSLLEQAQEIQAKLAVGLSKTQALRELGYVNPEQILAEANQEAAGATILPHSPYVPDASNAELQQAIESVLDDA